MAPRWSTRTTLGMVVAAGLIVGACGASPIPSGASPASQEASMAGLASPEPTRPPPTTAPSGPGPTAAVVVDLGTVGITPGGSRVTLHSFGPVDRSPEPPAGAAWFAADVEWCLPPSIVEATVGQVRYELALELSDGTTIEPDAHADAPDEIYAAAGTFRAGDCVRGALVFAVPSGTTPRYLLHVARNGGMRWALA